jgi:hypothetical protein
MRGVNAGADRGDRRRARTLRFQRWLKAGRVMLFVWG